ncbi:PPE domain-containing protein [Rhodococcus spelaei]|uniref:PPE domain-containing protein n=1 Tax=Rhodococcus spelaei TaxID=2546320 RepID=A0A541BR30_9NOCA|nr:PPE domain-containing protein [Rhodococcus spelaei]TQF74784.1 PPE domain-containing protein [Rhodococcus spelaei]
MTIGFTGVVWLPRGATWNSTSLNAGVGPVQLSAASSAWTALAASMADATATLTSVMGELGAGWQGLAFDTALAKLIPFHAWTETAGAMAAETAAKAATEAGAHTVARIAMPSLVEIAAVKTAKAAAYTTGGALAGAGAAAEAADRAMDVRAALVMEAYEAASSIVSVPQSFTPPPPLANGLGTSRADAPDAVPPSTITADAAVNPAQAALGAVMAQAQNPAVISAATQAGSIAGSGFSSVASTTASLAPAAISALTGGGGVGGPVIGGPVGGTAGTNTTRGGSAATRSVGTAGLSGAPGRGAPGAGVTAGSGGIGRAVLPDGWGAAASGDAASPVFGRGSAATGTVGADLVRGDTAATAPRVGHMGSATAGAGRGIGQDDEEHRTPDYLKGLEHFSDGRVVIPSVIGADPQ